MKKVIIKVALIISIILSVFAISACIDKENLPEDYVEVDSLRIEDAEIFLSPSGETSSYQLNIEILPTTATNIKLSYYIPSKYLGYVSVDQNGLIKAIALPVVEKDPDNPNEEVATPKIPLIVTSTSNKNAKLTIMLTIENAEVKQINFKQEIIEMLYKGESVKLEYDIVPYHAQDGRDITFTSLDPTIASVDAEGVVTPLQSGPTTIIAEGITKSGKTITGRISILVKYVAARYSLEVTNPSPKFKQTTTVSTNTSIIFNLLPLEPSSDPNPRIQWYVGEERITSQDGQSQYEHIPNSLNPQTYRVSVKVKAKEQEEIVYQSEEIHIYNNFSGFGYFYENNNEEPAANYMYGQEVTFNLNTSAAGMDHFDWYLRRIGQQDKDAIKVATTLAETPDLEVNLNLDGDYYLEAKAFDEDDFLQEGQGQEYEFNVNRYIIGDTIVINPNIFNEGIPPEIYNWYMHICDENGNVIDGTRASIGSTVEGETFYYSPSITGYIMIEGQGILNGVAAKVNGEIFSAYSSIIKICPRGMTDISLASNILDSSDYKYQDLAIRGNDSIDNVVIDGINEIGKFTPIVYWDAVDGVNTYWVEITNENGEVVLLNSTEDKEYFGDYYCILPSDFVDFNSKFKVRIKQKGGEFTNYICYGYKATSGSAEVFYDYIDVDRHCYYLSPINEVITNGYIRNMEELGDVLDYVISYEPSIGINSLVTTRERVTLQEHVYDREYSIKIFLDFDYSEIESFYPYTDDIGISLDEQLIDLYKSIKGAQYAYCETADLILQMDYDIDDGGYYINIYKNYNASTFINSDTVVEIDPAVAVSTNYSTSPYGDEYSDFEIYDKEGKEVDTTDQMYIAAENGKYPLPQTYIAKAVEEKIKSVIREIIGENMSDLQKATAFYDWLILNTVFEEAPAGVANAYNYNIYHLEGVFIDHKAVCDGLSKAFVMLCWFEGIPCYKVSGYVNGNGHAWNKVKLDNKWYVVDVTWGSFINEETVEGTVVDTEYINHKYFGMSDLAFAAMHTNSVIYGEYEASDYNYNYYESSRVNGLNLYIENEEEFVEFLNSYGVFTDSKKISLQLSSTYLAEGLDTLINNLNQNPDIEVIVAGQLSLNSGDIINIKFTHK